MYEHSNYYASFHRDSSTQSMLKQAEEFLLCGNYILNIADVCVAATADYLCMNLCIFENLGGKAVIIQQQSAIEMASKGLFLRFICKPNFLELVMKTITSSTEGITPQTIGK